MPANSYIAQSVSKLLESEEGNARYADQCISLRTHDPDCPAMIPFKGNPCGCGSGDCGDGEELIRVGGRWDRRLRKYDGEAENLMVLRVHPGQEEPARWFCQWLRCKASGDWGEFLRVYSVFFVGGRRGGKSRFAIWALLLFVTGFPKRNVWAISPTQQETAELDVALRQSMPRRWYKYRGDPKYEFRLINGSQILLMSGYKPKKLKRGGVDLVLYNEAQNMSHKGFVQLRGAVADSGGLVINAANPPDDPIGRWVEEACLGAEEGKILAKKFLFDPRKNPFIDYSALLSLSDEVDDATFRREVLGEFVPIGDVVFYAWSDSMNWVNPTPANIDVTRQYTKMFFGREVDHVIGVDFQKTPHMVANVCKIYLPEELIEEIYSKRKSDRTIKKRLVEKIIEEQCRAGTDLLIWCVDEIIVDNADEDDLIDGLESPAEGVRCPCCRGSEGYSGDNAIVIGDASGEWQDAERTKGKGSFDWFKARKWRFIKPPDPHMKKNPEISERVKCANALLKARSGKRRLMVSKHCEKTRKAMKFWPIKNDRPHKGSDFAHICDALTYVCWRVYPRRKKKGDVTKTDARTIKRFKGKSRVKGW